MGGKTIYSLHIMVFFVIITYKTINTCLMLLILTIYFCLLVVLKFFINIHAHKKYYLWIYILTGIRLKHLY